MEKEKRDKLLIDPNEFTGFPSYDKPEHKKGKRSKKNFAKKCLLTFVMATLIIFLAMNASSFLTGLINKAPSIPLFELNENDSIFENESLPFSSLDVRAKVDGTLQLNIRADPEDMAQLIALISKIERKDLKDSWDTLKDDYNDTILDQQ